MKLLKTIVFSVGILFSAQAYADLMCVITPAHDNPFFKAEADIAQETAGHARQSESQGRRQCHRRPRGCRDCAPGEEGQAHHPQGRPRRLDGHAYWYRRLRRHRQDGGELGHQDPRPRALRKDGRRARLILSRVFYVSG